MNCFNCPHPPHEGLCSRPTCLQEFNGEVCKCKPCLCYTAKAEAHAEKRKTPRGLCPGCAVAGDTKGCCG